MFKCICDLKYDWLRLNGVKVIVCCLGMYVCMYLMTNGRLEVIVRDPTAKYLHRNVNRTKRVETSALYTS